MIQGLPKELADKKLITPEQFEKIDLITSGKIVSVFYELRTLLYLGVMLFTTGAGILIYQNIGDLGHLISIILLSICAEFAFGMFIAMHSLIRTSASSRPRLTLIMFYCWVVCCSFPY
jgi:hypothetical protein